MTKKFSLILLLILFAPNLYAGNCPVKEDGIQYIDNNWILTTNAKNEGWILLDAINAIPMTDDTFVDVQIFNPAKYNTKNYYVYCYYYAKQTRVLTLVNEQTDIDGNNDWGKFKKLSYDLGFNEPLNVYSCNTTINATNKECTWEWRNDLK